MRTKSAKTVASERPEANLGAIGNVQVWDLATLKPNPLNPRGPVEEDDSIRELADSIRAKGLMEPLLITPAGVLVAGHRRHRACLLAGVHRVRVIVQQMSEESQLEAMLIENLQRQGLTPLQEARGFKALVDRGLRVADLVRRTGLPRVHITSHLALLDLPLEVQKWIESGRLVFGISAVLLPLDPETRLGWAERALAAGWTIAQLKKAVDAGGSSRPAAKKAAASQLHAGSGPVVTRSVALESLRRCRSWPLPLAVVERALDGVSCSCSGEGDEKHSDLCRNCPLAHFLGAFARETYDARQ